MPNEEQAFAQVMAEAVVADLEAHPVGSPLWRFVLRWFEETEPGYFTLHFLGEDEVEAVPENDRWYPLEWENLDRELARTERVAKDEGVAASASALAEVYEQVDNDPDEWQATDAIVAAVAAVTAALERSDVQLSPEFTATATHFEAFGGVNVLQRMGRRDWLERLAPGDDLPDE